MEIEHKKQLSLKVLDEAMQQRNKDTDERLGVMEDTLGDLSSQVDEKFTQVLESIKAMHSVSRVVEKEGRLSTDVDAQETNDGIVFGKDDNPENDVWIERTHHESVHSAEFKTKAEQMQFDKEMIQVLVMPSMEKFPDRTFTLGVNGRMILIVRGVKQWIPRAYAEVMARAKVSSYGNVEFRNDQNELEVKNPETKAARFPFQVVTDKSPFASQWFERVTNDQQ